MNNYKTVGLYGSKVIEFSIELTNLIKQYIKNNKIKDVLFNHNKMSNFVGNMLDMIQVKDRVGCINYLRKSFVSTYEDENMSVDERIVLADKMKHSVNTTLKYKRKVVIKEDDEYDMYELD